MQEKAGEPCPQLPPRAKSSPQSQETGSPALPAGRSDPPPPRPGPSQHRCGRRSGFKGKSRGHVVRLYRNTALSLSRPRRRETASPRCAHPTLTRRRAACPASHPPHPQALPVTSGEQAHLLRRLEGKLHLQVTSASQCPGGRNPRVFRGKRWFTPTPRLGGRCARPVRMLRHQTLWGTRMGG